jgi:hydroxylamine reductase
MLPISPLEYTTLVDRNKIRNRGRNHYVSMFCFQCEQTAGGKGCTKIGVCGKKPEVAQAHNELVCFSSELAGPRKKEAVPLKGMNSSCRDCFTVLTNVNFDKTRGHCTDTPGESGEEKQGGGKGCDAAALFQGETDTVSLRSTLLFGLYGMAAYAWHAHYWGKTATRSRTGFTRSSGSRQRAYGREWLGLIMEFGQVNLPAWRSSMRPTPGIRSSCSDDSPD